jgi:iron complex transport system substrate-binding protein
LAILGCQEDNLSDKIFQLTDKGGWQVGVDQFGREIALIPKGADIPEGAKGYPPSQIVRTPVQRVIVTSGTYDPSVITYLGRLDSILGTSDQLDDVLLPDFRKRYRDGFVTHVGNWDSLDFETILTLKPDIVLVSSQLTLGKLEELGIPAAGTYSGLDNGMVTRLRLFKFLGALYGEEGKSEELVRKVESAFSDIRRRVEGHPKPTIVWGLFFNNRVLAMSGGYWFSDLMDIAGGDYLFREASDNSRELSLEEFIVRGGKADIYFAQTLYETGVENKGDLIRYHPDLARFKSFGEGGTVAIPNKVIFQDPANVDKIAYAMAALFHPDLFDQNPEGYFHILR